MVVDCLRNQEQFMPDYSVLGAITVTLLSGIRDKAKSALHYKVKERIEAAKEYFLETQIPDEMLFSDSYTAWPFRRAVAALARVGKVDIKTNTPQDAKQLLHEYLVKITTLDALLRDNKLDLISAEDIDELNIFFAALVEVELERKQSYHIPGPLDTAWEHAV